MQLGLNGGELWRASANMSPERRGTPLGTEQGNMSGTYVHSTQARKEKMQVSSAFYLFPKQLTGVGLSC